MGVDETWFAVDRNDRVLMVWTSPPGAWPVGALCLEASKRELFQALNNIEGEDGPALFFRHDPSDGSTRFWRRGGTGTLFAAELPELARMAVRRVVIDVDATQLVALDLRDWFEDFETLGESPLVEPKQPLEAVLEQRRLQLEAWALLDEAMRGHPDEGYWAEKSGGRRASAQLRSLKDDEVRARLLEARAPLAAAVHDACLKIVERQLAEITVEHANPHDYAWQAAHSLVASWDPNSHPLAEHVPYLGPGVSKGILLRAKREGIL